VWKKNLAGFSVPLNPQIYPQARVDDLWISGACGSTPAGTAELIIFDGVFD
jgi:hypothetical protein